MKNFIFTISEISMKGGWGPQFCSKSVETFETVETVDTVETVETVETMSMEAMEIVQTVETIEYRVYRDCVTFRVTDNKARNVFPQRVFYACRRC